MRTGELDVDTVEDLFDGAADPLLDTLPRTGDLQGVEPHITGQGRGQYVGGRIPLEEVGQLWVGHQALDADLFPFQSATVGELAGAGHCGASQPLLEGGEVGHRNHPAKPATAELLTGTHRLPVDRLVGGGMVEHLDDLQVATIGEWKNVVPGAETGMESAVLELAAQRLAQLGDSGLQTLRASYERQVIQMHGVIVSSGPPERETGSSAAAAATRRCQYGGFVQSDRPFEHARAAPEHGRAPNNRRLPLVGLGSSTVYPGTTAQAFELAAAVGYDGVELMVGIDPPSTDIDYVRKLVDYHQVPVLSVHAPCLVITQNVWGTDPWEKLSRSCRAAADLGADVVVVHPPFLWQRDYARNFVAGIRGLSRQTGITLAVENMYPWRAPGATVFGYVPDWDPTHQDYDALTLDLSHAATAQARSLDYVDAWGARLRHLHLTDGLGSGRDEHLFPGQGNQDAWQIVEQLARRSYTGHIIHEINTRRAADNDERAQQLAEALNQTRQYLQQGRAQAHREALQ